MRPIVLATDGSASGVAKERTASVIVIASHHWGRVHRALFGSVSQGVVQAAPCSVLVVPAAPVPQGETKSDNKPPVEV